MSLDSSDRDKHWMPQKLRGRGCIQYSCLEQSFSNRYLPRRSTAKLSSYYTSSIGSKEVCQRPNWGTGEGKGISSKSNHRAKRHERTWSFQEASSSAQLSLMEHVEKNKTKAQEGKQKPVLKPSQPKDNGELPKMSARNFIGQVTLGLESVLNSHFYYDCCL